MGMGSGGGISAIDIYGGAGGRIGSGKNSQLVEATGPDATVQGSHPAKWWLGLVALLVILRLLWERA